MKEIKVVIGKNFGDEGKGATVHHLCLDKKTMVVRHNGGAQAGHTVEENEFRFVFHQLGSGSYRGCATYWSQTFLPDLFKLGDEVEAFMAAMLQVGSTCATPLVYAHPECYCTTIYDVLLNSIVEQLRGDQKHGSCGMGIYEAVLRSREESFVLRLKDFENADLENIVQCMRRVRDQYAAKRLECLLKEMEYPDRGSNCDELLSLFYDENVLWNASQAMLYNFRTYVKLEDWEQIKKGYNTIIFENAQGLMLDEDNREYYPHLTPSHTGLINVANLLANEEEVSLEVVYVTRTYVTRHGAGRLDYECEKEAINPRVQDRTNVPNVWQDSLRYALHPADKDFFSMIEKDLCCLKQNKGISKVQVTLYVTHLDETDNKMMFCDGCMDISQFTEICNEQGIKVKRGRYNDGLANNRDNEYNH